MSRIPALTNKSIAVMILFIFMLTFSGLGWTKLKMNSKRDVAIAQFEEIYGALQRYETRNGALPVVAFYPLDPISGTDSIRYELARYVVDPAVFISPSSHPILKKAGLTYLWNPTYNGSRLDQGENPDWLLIDIQALHPKSSKAHRQGYLTLYSNGAIDFLSQPPPSLEAYKQL